MSKNPPPAKPRARMLGALDDLNGMGLTEIATGKTEAAPAANPVAAAPAPVVQTVTVNTGEPLMLPVAEIVEDPNQPRTIFDAEALQELSDSIKQHGIKTPISVKPKDLAGHYLINHGARRYRAAKMAGLKEVPAFIDGKHDGYAQMIENIQRDDLKPMEIARFIASELRKATKQKDIATKLGKGKQWVSKFAALADAPDFIAAAADGGRLTSSDAIYELVTLLEKNPEHTEAAEGFLEGDGPVTQAEVRSFIQGIKNPKVPLTELPERSKAEEGSPKENSKPTPKMESKSGSGSEKVPLTELSGEDNSNIFTEVKDEATRTSTPEEQKAAAQQHETDTFFRQAHQEDKETHERQTTKPNKSTSSSEDEGPAFHSGFDQEKGEQAEKEPKEIVTTPILKAVLMFTKGSKGGTVNLEVATDYGYLMVRFEGEDSDVQVKADSIQLKALMSS